MGSCQLAGVVRAKGVCVETVEDEEAAAERQEACHAEVAWRELTFDTRAGAVMVGLERDSNQSTSEDWGCGGAWEEAEGWGLSFV